MGSLLALPAGAALFAAVAWGVTFPVFSMVLTRLDPFQVSAERYGVGALVLLAILAAREGRSALSFGADGRTLILLGLAGFAAFNLLLTFGIRSAGPQHGALFMAMTPALAMLVQAIRTRTAPPLARIPFVAAAFVVAGHGLHPASLVGDLALLAAVLCWVCYTLGAGALQGWSSLRFTTLTAVAGAVGLIAAALIATFIGVSHVPSFADYSATSIEMGYLSVGGVVFAVFAWAFAVRGLGPQRAALFMNVVPISAFVTTILFGSRPMPLEIAGAAVTILALIGDNVLTSWRSRPHTAAVAQAA
jgi:drug/metabolite transporter (DMT)-like permease